MRSESDAPCAPRRTHAIRSRLQNAQYARPAGARPGMLKEQMSLNESRRYAAATPALYGRRSCIVALRIASGCTHKHTVLRHIPAVYRAKVYVHSLVTCMFDVPLVTGQKTSFLLLLSPGLPLSQSAVSLSRY